MKLIQIIFVFSFLMIFISSCFLRKNQNSTIVEEAPILLLKDTFEVFYAVKYSENIFWIDNYPIIIYQNKSYDFDYHDGYNDTRVKACSCKVDTNIFLDTYREGIQHSHLADYNLRQSKGYCSFDLFEYTYKHDSDGLIDSFHTENLFQVDTLVFKYTNSTHVLGFKFFGEVIHFKHFKDCNECLKESEDKIPDNVIPFFTLKMSEEIIEFNVKEKLKYGLNIKVDSVIRAVIYTWRD